MPAHMKPKKGAATAMRRARRRLLETRERAAKDAAKERDGYACRRCDTRHYGFSMENGAQVCLLEAAHLIDKGMGGDGGKFSCERRHYVTLCRDCHQGPRSLHSGHVRVVFNETLMGDGPCEFFDVDLATTAKGKRLPAELRGRA